MRRVRSVRGVSAWDAWDAAKEDPWSRSSEPSPSCSVTAGKLQSGCDYAINFAERISEQFPKAR